MNKQGKQRKKGSAAMAIGLLLLVAALALSLYNFWDADRADQAAQGALTQLEEQIVQRQQQEQNDPTVIDPELYLPPSQLEELEPIDIDGDLYIGIVRVPSCGIDLPVMAEWSEKKLKTAPCAYTGSIAGNDLVVAGHNYRRHFSPLKWVDLGADVYFITVDGQRIHYVVDAVETIPGDGVAQMVDAEYWDLTLFTCTTGGRSRCTVRCVREHS